MNDKDILRDAVAFYKEKYKAINVNIHDAATEMGRSPQTLVRMAERGEIKMTKIASTWHMTVYELARLTTGIDQEVA